jgi:hypothetical protein
MMSYADDLSTEKKKPNKTKKKRGERRLKYDFLKAE